jgi:hypothetical protein
MENTMDNDQELLSEIDREKILNPETDSIGAFQLAISLMIVASVHNLNAKKAEEHFQIVAEYVTPKILQIWIKMFPEEEYARNREMIYEELHDSFAALVHESIEPEDYQILVEHILDLLQNKDLRLIVMAFYVGIGKIDNELYPEEAGVMLKAADIWGIDMEQVTQDKEGRVYELIKEYDLSAYARGKIANDNDSPHSSCFIATVVLDDVDHPSLASLREFRDGCLLNTNTGRKFINAYYDVGPVIASYISKKPVLKIFVKYLVVIPLSLITYVINKINKD